LDLRRRDRHDPGIHFRDRHQQGVAAAGVGGDVVGGDGNRDHGPRRAVLRPVSGDARGKARSHRGAQAGMMARGRTGLLSEVFVMAWDTLIASKMRSALTVLGVVIGITSIVGMTSLIRGFDQSFRDAINTLGPDTIIVQKWGALSFSSGKTFLEVARRPNLTKEDAEAIERDCASVVLVDVWLGATGQAQSRIYYGHERTRQLGILGATENWSAVNFAKVEAGRVFSQVETEHRRQVVLLGNSPWKALFPNTDPIGKTVRIAGNQFTVIGPLGPR